MIRLLFSLRFRSQLRRTRPELLGSLEQFIIRAAEAAGGHPKNERRLLTLSFDENALGVWLDIFVLVESIMKFLNEAAEDLYGYTMVIGRDILDEEGEGLCRQFSREADGGGIWCDPTAQRALGYYMYFDKLQARQSAKGGAPPGEYIRLKGIKTFGDIDAKVYPQRETILKVLGKGETRNLLLLGPPYSGKRDGLYRYCREIPRESSPAVPLLIVRFGAGGRFFSPLADAYSPGIREFIANSGAARGEPHPSLSAAGTAEILQELDRLGEALFRDRLRSEISAFMARTAARFFLLLLETYAAAAAGVPVKAVLILENIHRAEDGVARLFMDTWAAFAGRGNLLVYGTATLGQDAGMMASGSAGPVEERIKAWDRVFSRVVRLDAGAQAALLPEMSRDLWEIAYAFHLLGRYFPGALLGSLLEEEGKNPPMISRALELLGFLGIVDLPDDPQPRIRNCAIRAERVLGERKEKVRTLVRNRLLAWVSRRRIYPCFALLEAFAELGNGGEAPFPREIAQGDEFVLRGIVSDMVNGTYARIEQVIKSGHLERIIGSERVFTVLYLFKTSKALIHGDEREIREVFSTLPAAAQLYPAYKAQVLANVTAYHLGVKDVSAALETVKEAVLLSQDRSWSGLAQSYRLFALVCLIKQQVGETIDYMTFAVENAEKSGNFDELGVSSYYAATAQYLFGNLSRAEWLAAEAETQSAAAGRSEWTDRARFFRGKLAFDLGRYQDARVIFEDILKNPVGLLSPAKEGLLDAWVYRALVYIENPLIAKPDGGGLDADLFEIEAAYLAGDYRRTVELADRLAEAVPQDYFLYTEQPDWRSGFAQCELLLLPQKEFWDRMISTYHSLALCRLSGSGGEAAVQNMQRILRDERLSEMDPNDAFYFYAWYQVLEESGSAQVDMNTAVSMAFKRLQRRASHIDDMETRQSYLSRPRWNSALSLAAKEYKLI
ncbi:hypothetical protein AGMMS49587_15980 [Spirochaetia bacterium]|nr:hypothetical protein AGMMS49587_15980 [Spirochaetia bacterium]